MVPGGVVESAGFRRSARVIMKRIEYSVIAVEDDTEDDEEWEMRPGRISGRARMHEGIGSRTSVRDKDVVKPLESVEAEPPTAQAMARKIEVWSLSDSSDDSDSGSEGNEIEEAEATVAALSAEDLGLYMHVMKVIEEQGDLKKLKIDHLKAYLRHYGLRLVGVKAILLSRIEEHLKVKDGQGLKLYPRQSFCFDCTGDVVLGDVVLFQQKVYETFDIVSRRARDPPIGLRWVAGRVVNESYGAGKQQHTFTIEVLWSTGVRPLYPMKPLLIKGRNLYRIHTLRQVIKPFLKRMQRWFNEAERQEVLHEKHARGCEARAKRAAAKAAQRARGFCNPRSDLRHGSRRYEITSIPEGMGIGNRNDQVAGHVTYATSAQSMQHGDPGHSYSSQGVGIGNRSEQVVGRVGYAISAQSMQHGDPGHSYSSQGVGIGNRSEQVVGRVGYAISAQSMQHGDPGRGHSYTSQGVGIGNRSEQVAGRVSYAISAQSMQHGDPGRGHSYTSQGVGIGNRSEQVAGRVSYAISAQSMQHGDPGHGHPYTSQGEGIGNRTEEVAGYFQQGPTHRPYPMDNISAHSDWPCYAPVQSTNRAHNPFNEGPRHVPCSTRGCTNAGAKQCVSTSCLWCCRGSNIPCARHR